MRSRAVWGAMFIFGFVCSITTEGQEPAGKIGVVVLNDGRRMEGRIEELKDGVKLSSGIGAVTFPMAEIKTIKYQTQEETIRILVCTVQQKDEEIASLKAEVLRLKAENEKVRSGNIATQENERSGKNEQRSDFIKGPLGDVAKEERVMGFPIDFKDNMEKYAGKRIFAFIRYMGHDLRDDAKFGRKAKFSGHTAQTVAEPTGISFDIKITLPSNLEVPNATFLDWLVILFDCTKGNFDEGNVACLISRR